MIAAGTQKLRTDRLILRKLRESDAGELHDGGCLGKTPGEALDAVRKMMENNDDPMNFHWVLEYQGRAAGRIRAWDVSLRDDYAQLGYDIAEAYRCKGLMTEAVGAVCRYLLTEAAFNRVYCMVRETNHASCRVCEKAGMTLDGVMRRHFRQPDGTYTDVRVYSILACEI